MQSRRRVRRGQPRPPRSRPRRAGNRPSRWANRCAGHPHKQTRTITRHDGPDHLGLRHSALPWASNGPCSPRIAMRCAPPGHYTSLTHLDRRRSQRWASCSACPPSRMRTAGGRRRRRSRARGERKGFSCALRRFLLPSCLLPFCFLPSCLLACFLLASLLLPSFFFPSCARDVFSRSKTAPFSCSLKHLALCLRCRARRAAKQKFKKAGRNVLAAMAVGVSDGLQLQ